MSIAKGSIERPITTLMIFAAVILVGLISWVKLPQELFPTISYPQITVVTSYENAAPEEIESLITKIVEEAVGTVNGVKRISSISKEGSSLVMVEFKWGTNMDFAALNVREKVDLIKERLPREAQEPIVMKYNPFDLPVANLAVTGPLSPLEMRELARKFIKDAMEKVDGVASATITGGDQREILVEIDQARLRASQISIVSIVESLKSANLNYPAGTIKESFYEYLIRTMGEFQKIEEIQDTPTALDIPEEKAKTVKEKEKEEQKSRRLVFLKDISTVKDSVKEKTSIARYNGKPSVSLVVRKQSGTNTLAVVKGIKREIRKLLNQKLPKGVKIQITYDQSQFIQEAISSVRDAGLQGAVLSFIVLFLFLWEMKSSLIITSAIPLSITATAFAMFIANLFGANINLNMMSLGGLAMGVGMVVDNANVVIENIYRYRQLGKSFKDSIVDGTTEMISPIMGSTITNIAVFVPFVFVVGIAGQIFKQLSFTISFSLISSIVVAISLVPVLLLLCKDSPKDKENMQRVEEKTEVYREQFKSWLVGMMENRGAVVGACLIAFVVSIVVLVTHPRQFMPKVDQRQFIIKVDLAPGTRLEITDKVVRKVEFLLLGMPETKDITVNIGSTEEKDSAEKSAVQTLGSHQSQILVNLKKKSRQARRSTDDVIQFLKGRLEKEETERAQIEYIAQETSLGSALEQGAPIAIELKGADLRRLSTFASIIESKLKNISGVYGVKSSMSPPSPETKLLVRKDKASLYGLSVRDIAVTSQVALKGYVATKFKEKNIEEDVDIRVRLRPQDRNALNNLRHLLVHSPLGMDVSLSDLAYLTKGTGPTEIKRIDQQRSVIVTANIYKRNFSRIADDINTILAALRRTTIPMDYSVELAGEQQRMKESFASLAFALTFAIILVYMIMAAEFESLWQPLLIMFTVPLSLIGVAFSLFITRTPLSVVAYLGIIMLGGIAVNNGIVLIEFINSLRQEGYSPLEAAIEASRIRLRPILMTSLTTILGLLPLALGIGEGSELQAPMSLTVMGGLISSTFLTLVFIPAAYVLLMETFPWLPSPALVTWEEPAKSSPVQAEGVAVLPGTPVHTQPAPAEQAQPQVAATPEPVIPAADVEILKQKMQTELAAEQAKLSALTEQLRHQQTSHASSLGEREKQLAEIQTQLQEKEKHIANLQRHIEEQKTQHDSSVASKRGEMEQLHRSLEEKQKEMGDLSAKLQSQLQGYKIAVSEREKQIIEVQKQLAEREQHIADLHQEIEDQRKQQQALLAQRQKATRAEPRSKPAPRPAPAQPILPEKAAETIERRQTAEPAARETVPAAEPTTPLAAESTSATAEVSPRQAELLEKLKTLKKITRKEYADLLHISIPTAARDLKELVDKKRIIGKGPLGPGRWYELT
ncbi:MAG TPA: efflux RND transporter permease subunit [Candidatus Omnitrophota bacterium]|nr:efflux RND transporter permease subunit [Candidatus Omnitrophota bacterium]